MSLPTITGTGRLVSDPKRGVTSANNPWCNCVVRLVGYKKTDAGWEEDVSYVATIAAFGDIARQLATFAKGDELQFSGKLKDLSVWSPARGEPRAQLSIVANELTRPEKRSSRRSQETPAAPVEHDWPRPGQPQPQAVPAGSSQQRPTSRADIVRASVLGTPAADAPPTAGGEPIDLAAYRNGASTKLRRAHHNNPRTGRPA